MVGIDQGNIGCAEPLGGELHEEKRKGQKYNYRVSIHFLVIKGSSKKTGKTHRPLVEYKKFKQAEG